MTRASLDKAPQDVAAMFDDVAGRYDLTNDLLSLGQDRLWRRAVVKAVAARPGEVVLDIAAGTGTSSEPFADSGVHVVPADFSLGMLRVGHRRRADLGFTAADAMRLPFADDSFDAVTMSFGLRNVSDTAAALAEFLRVTRPGGRLVICEFSAPTNRAFRKVYQQYLMGALPPVARRFSSNPEAYVYLAESIQAWPDQRGLGEIIRGAGWTEVQWRNLSGGIVALHRATKPLTDEPDRPTEAS
ncbi:MAG TPA: demethylmenaquinone methyltransferase [Intrasporangiaceae bacterium]|nr:demethylmenaquinone methyltransferase [Intrasporangiaceae bacterium]